MPVMSLGAAFSAKAAADPDRPAVTCGSQTVTRAQIEALSNQMAHAFADLGVVHGDLVTIGWPNSVEFYAATLAIWKLGAVPQPVSPRLPERERLAIVDLAEARIVLADAPSVGADRPYLAYGWRPDAALPTTPPPDATPPTWKAPTSGGSTGRPKLILAGEPGVVDTDGPAGMGSQQDGVMAVPGPLYHNAPFAFSSRGLVHGNHIVTMARFDAAATLEMIETHRADWILLVPTMMLRIWRLPEEQRLGHDVSSLQVVWHMAAPCPPWLKENWIQWLGGERIFELYAGTEAQAVTIVRGDEWMAKRGTVGRVTAGQMKVFADDGSECPPGTVGEIYMRPPDGVVTYEYRGASAKRTADGWESLGDMGWIDADGYVFLSDRLSDMILSGGANIYPAEIEAAIDEHPDVRSSCAIGMPDDDLGNTVHAIVQPADGVVLTADALRTFLADRLVRYKIPRTYEFTTEPLRDDAGKVRRSALRAERVAVESNSNPTAT